MGAHDGQLTINEREQILLGINRGEILTAIAEQLGRLVSTISREVKNGNGSADYSAWHAHEPAREQARRPKPFKLAPGRLLDEVARRLEQFWSPQEIAVHLRFDHADDPEMRVSHETTTCQSLFVQGPDEGSRSAVGTLAERSTTLTLLLHLPDGKSAEQVEAAMRATIGTLPTSLAQATS